MVTRPDLDVGVLVVGAGPQGLAAVLHLLERAPRLADDLLVADPAGWMGRWNDRFARFDIAHLRSPGVHHPGCDPHELTDWCRRRGHPSDLPYSIPTTTGFRAYCEHLVATAGLTEAVTPVGVQALAAGAARSVARLDDGTTVSARHVVLAVDPARRQLPTWVPDTAGVAPERLAHAEEVDLRGLRLDGEVVVVVGGGLTAGHLAVGAAARGATVHLVARRALRESMFDTDPGWLGPRNLRAYYAIDDPRERLRQCLAARDGGSIPPWMARRLRALAADGVLEIHAPTEVRTARPTGSGLALELTDGTELAADRVWLATGTRPDVHAHRLTAALAAGHPATVVDGWPVLERDLRWPGTNVHLLGRLAMLALGPAAGNLWGARMGATIVAAGICAQQLSSPA